MHCAASNIVSGPVVCLLVTQPEPLPRGHLNSYVLPLKRAEAWYPDPHHSHGVGHSAGFASAGEPYAAALEVAGRQSTRYLRAGEATAAPTHFATG